MNTCVYYTLSINKTYEHLENHNRIIKSVMYLKSKFETLRIFSSEIVYDYLYRTIEKISKEDFAKKFNSLYSSEYLEKIKSLCDELSEDEIVEGDTYFSNVTYNEIMDNFVILFNACHQIINKTIKNAYCLIRPPSHHSSLNQYSGFCVINQTYLTAKYLHDNYNKKVLILDYDVHHGNGTQNLVNDNIQDNIYFVSMHCYAKGFYPETGSVTENNDKVLNVPMAKGSTEMEYLHQFYRKVRPFIEAKNPDIIIISNGLDAHIEDPFKVMQLREDFYKFVAQYLMLLDKPLIYILEGGYNPDVIGTVSEEIINVLLDKHQFNSEYNQYLDLLSKERSFPELREELSEIIKSGLVKAREIMDEHSHLAIEKIIKVLESEEFAMLNLDNSSELSPFIFKLDKLHDNMIDHMKFKYRIFMDIFVETLGALNKNKIS